MSNQKPDITPYQPLGDDFRDRVVTEAFGLDDFSDMESSHQTTVAAVINERFNYVFQRVSRLVYGDTNGSNNILPDEFQILFSEECIFAAIRAIRGHDAAVKQRGQGHIDQLWESVVSNYTPDSPSTDSLTSKASIDRYITSMTLRLENRVLIPSHVIDDHTKIAWTYIWNWDKWPFRRRETTLTINADGTVSASGEVSTFGIDQIACKQMYYTTPVGATLNWITPDGLSRERLRHTTTGRPRYFRIEDSWVSGSGHSKSIILVPSPDQAYTVNASILVQAPPLPVSRTSTDEFTALPIEFHPILWDIVCGRVLSQFDLGDRYLRSAEQRLEYFGNEFADQGQIGTDFRPVDSQGLLPDLPTLNSWGFY